jgi:MoaA/NifB/PqqE/SkfB family radical SAM enzyme
MIKKMDIKNKLYQEFVIAKLKNENIRKGTTSPLIVELDPTAVCDLACPGCISEDIIATNNSFTSERLLQIAKELKDTGVKGVILIGGGEPLSHPASRDIIKFFGENDIRVGITTNGTFMDRMLEEIAEYSFWTRVSIDAATQKTFDILRPSKTGKSVFQKVLSNIERLSKIKKGKLGYSFLVRTEVDAPVSNIYEIYDAAKLAKEIGCDYFEIKPSYNYKNGIAHTLVKHSEKSVQEIKNQIKRLEELVDENFSIIKAITLDDMLNGVKQKQVKTYDHCPVAELRTLITPLGVYVCPYWRGNNKFTIGDIKNISFKELWHSQKKREVMTWLDPSTHCANLHCLRDESNLEILKIITKLENGKTIEIIKEFDRFF